MSNRGYLQDRPAYASPSSITYRFISPNGRNSLPPLFLPRTPRQEDSSCFRFGQQVAAPAETCPREHAFLGGIYSSELCGGGAYLRLASHGAACYHGGVKFIGLILAAASVFLLGSCTWVGQLYPSQMSQIASSPSHEAEEDAEPAEPDEAEDSSATKEPSESAPQPAAAQEQSQEPRPHLPIAPVMRGQAAQTPPAPAQPAESKPDSQATAPSPDMPAAKEKEDPALIQPSAEQMAAAIKMLREQQAAAQSAPKQVPQAGQPPAPAAPATGPQRQQTTPQAAPRPQMTTRQAPSYTPRAEQQEFAAPFPEQDPAQQRGLRSPSLPKLLPMDIDGKIHSPGHQ